MSKFPNQLRKFREAAGLNQPDLARLIDTAVQNISRIEKGDRKLTKEWAERFAPHLGVSPQELMFPRPAEGARKLTYEPIEESNFAAYTKEFYHPKRPGGIPEIDVRAGAGEGAVGEVVTLQVGTDTVAAHRVVDEWLIGSEYLREAVKDPTRSIILPVQGDSMMPNYMPGDRVVIDLTEHELRNDAVYLISDGMSPPQIKRLQRIPFTIPARCRIISDNTIYPPQEVEIDLVHIIGKVAAYVGRR